MGSREKENFKPESVKKAIERDNKKALSEMGKKGAETANKNNKIRAEIRDLESEILEIESNLNDIEANIEVTADGDVVPRARNKTEETEYNADKFNKKIKAIDEKSLGLY